MEQFALKAVEQPVQHVDLAVVEWRRGETLPETGLLQHGPKGGKGDDEEI